MKPQTPMTDKPNTPELDNQPSEVDQMKAKSEQMAELVKMFLPIIDMVIPHFDLDHADKCVSSMIQEADRYDTLSVVTPGGYRHDDRTLLQVRAEVWDAIVKLIRARKKMIDHVVHMDKRKGEETDLMNELFPTLRK